MTRQHFVKLANAIADAKANTRNLALRAGEPKFVLELCCYLKSVFSHFDEAKFRAQIQVETSRLIARQAAVAPAENEGRGETA